jgi:hypothetical protein
MRKSTMKRSDIGSSNRNREDYQSGKQTVGEKSERKAVQRSSKIENKSSRKEKKRKRKQPTRICLPSCY